MANRHKSKGDRYEREAVTVLTSLLPDLAVERPERMLGAGRRDDKGDIRVLDDTAVQVKAWGQAVNAIASGASGASVQAVNWDMRFAVAMVPVVGARAVSVRWLFACLAWPVELDSNDVKMFSQTSAAIAWVRDEKTDIPRTSRIALISRANGQPTYLAPGEAWAAAYRTASQHPARSSSTRELAPA